MLSGCLSVMSLCSVCDVGVLWPNGWMHQRATCYGGRPRRRPHCVRWGRSSFPQKGHSSPKFSTHVGCGQTSGWIKMSLATELCLGPGHLMLHGDPAPPKDRNPQFSATRMDQDVTWYASIGHVPGDIVLDADSAPQRKATQHPHFSSHVYCCQTIAHLSNC